MVKMRNRVIWGALTLGGALALAGCASNMEIPGQSTESSAPSASSSATAAPSPTTTASGTPLTLSCTQILTLQNVYDFNPNYGENPNLSVPSQITPLTQIGGVACGWVNQTSGDTFVVGVAKPDAATETAAANTAAATLQPVPTYGTSGVEGFFGVVNNVGVAEVFANGYWIVVTSSGFIEPGDAGQLVESIIGNLK